MAAGDPKSDLLWFIGMIFLLGFFWLSTGGLDRPEEYKGPFIKPPAPLDTGEVYGPDGSGSRVVSSRDEVIGLPLGTIDETVSPFKDLITVRRGNAGRAEQPYEEYITLEYSRRGTEAVNITGWMLGNSPLRGDRRVAIPQGVSVLWADEAKRITTDIILQPGDRAIVLTGRMYNRYPVAINTSFRSNICLGYLEALASYNFIPNLNRQCPRPIDEVGVNLVDDTCYNFIRRLARCHTPEFIDYGDKRGYVDNVGNLTQACKTFILDHYNYEACVNNHWQSEDFYQSEWRIYLNQIWPMWANNREIITLYDREGRVVDQLSY